MAATARPRLICPTLSAAPSPASAPMLMARRSAWAKRSAPTALRSDQITFRFPTSPPARSTLVHAPPAVTAGATATFDGGGSPVQIDPTLTVSDPDSGDYLTGATVKISGGFIAGDTLNFTTQNGISEASYSNGELTLTGNATVEQYQTALESITYSFNPANGDPTAGNTDTARTISYMVNDGVASSTAATSTLDVVHAPPSVTAGAVRDLCVRRLAGDARQRTDRERSRQRRYADRRDREDRQRIPPGRFPELHQPRTASPAPTIQHRRADADRQRHRRAIPGRTGIRSPSAPPTKSRTSHTIDWTVSDSADDVGRGHQHRHGRSRTAVLTAGATATFIGGSTNARGARFRASPSATSTAQPTSPAPR